MNKPSPSSDLFTDLASLGSLNKSQLQALWAKHFGQVLAMPPRTELLVACLTYRLQSLTYGGLRPTTRARLLKLAAGLDAGQSVSARTAIKPGTRLLRDWQGATHEVIVSDDGFLYAGQRHASLSKIARLITGTRWSGPLFFGIKPSARHDNRA